MLWLSYICVVNNLMLCYACVTLMMRLSYCFVVADFIVWLYDQMDAAELNQGITHQDFTLKGLLT